jgi:hypothetical protein
MSQLPGNDSSDADNDPLMFLEAQETQRMLNQSLDVTRKTLQQKSELSRRVQATGISYRER